MTDDHNNPDTPSGSSSRRSLLRGAAVATVATGVAGAVFGRWAQADDEYEHSDDDDSSGKDDDGNDDDNSGRGNSHDGHVSDDDDDSADDNERDDDTPPQSSSPVSGVLTVEIRDETFIPAHIVIDPGQTVTWNNLDDDEHTATGVGFDTGELDRGESGSITFDKPGVFPYICQFHAHMQGSVTVRGEVIAATPEPEVEASPGSSPQAVPDDNSTPERISIIDFAFTPPLLDVPVGTTVIWTNDGDAPHTVTGEFLSSDLLQAGDSVQFTFRTVGEFDYACALHSQMIATITVVPA